MPSGSICWAGSGWKTWALARAPLDCVSVSMLAPAWPNPQLTVHCSTSSTAMYSRPVVRGSPYTEIHGRSVPVELAWLQVVVQVRPSLVETESLTSVRPCRSEKYRLPAESLTMLLSPPPTQVTRGLPIGGKLPGTRWKVLPPSSERQTKLAVVRN